MLRRSINKSLLFIRGIMTLGQSVAELNNVIGKLNELYAKSSRSRAKGEFSNDPSNSLPIDRGTAGNASPFYCYNSVLDAEEIIRRHSVANLLPRSGHLTNFLGVAIDTKFFPQLLDGRSGEIEGLPIPANWHADMAEFAAALRAVDLATNSFTVIELGCGWGCWMNNAGVAARRRGLNVQLIGIEGDEGHIDFAVQACKTNGFREDQVQLHRGVAAAESGIALFPRQDVAGGNWGLQPVFKPSESRLSEARKHGTYDELPMLSLADVASDCERVDLLHVDIQGGEADLIAGCLPFLNGKVAYLVIGTHSREIEGRLFKLMIDAGWRLEIERPGLLRLEGDRPQMWVDGIHGWRNLALLPPDTNGPHI